MSKGIHKYKCGKCDTGTIIYIVNSTGLINATSSMIERISNDLAKVKIRNAEPNTRQQIHNGARIACLSSVLNYLKQKKESYIKNSNKTI